MLSIVLPYFPQLRTMNSRKAAVASSATTREVREDASMLWRAAMQCSDDPGRLGMPLHCAIHADVAFSMPDKRRRDLDNLVALCKPLLDGAVDAGIMVDDALVTSMYLSKHVADPQQGESPGIAIWLRVR